jgi:(p)ppGpp synthase/HD superfamily hydrolase
MIAKARDFATKAHGDIGQVRKYTGDPYIIHPASVAKRVSKVSNDENLVVAAWLHDTVEDTEATLEDIQNEFGKDIHDLVESLTDISTPKDGNRAKRKEIDRQHTALGSPGAHTVKLADLIDNADSIMEYDQGFAKVFIKEKKLLLEVLSDGDQTLFDEAKAIIQNYEMSKDQ